jgi:AcrR family transcriptional regulator
LSSLSIVNAPARSPAKVRLAAPLADAVEARRRRILDAAARCFAERGFARTRIDEVARAARVSRALVYHHFGSKEALAEAVQEHMLDEWTSEVDAAIAAAKTVGDALAAWLRINLADTRRRPLLRAINADPAILAGFEDAARRSTAEWRDKLSKLLQRGVARGELCQDLDVESTAEVLRAMQIGMMQHLFTDQPYVDVSGERHLRAATELLVAGLRRAPRGRAS